MEATVGTIAATLAGDVLGDMTITVRDALPLSKAGPGTLSFLGDETKIRELDTTNAGVVLISRKRLDELTEAHRAMRTFVAVDNSLDAFISLLQSDRPVRPRKAIGLSEHAFIAESASVGEGTNIHPGATIGDDVVIGKNCDVHPGVVIGAGCSIGDNVTIHPNAVLYCDLEIGNDVIIHANAVLGADGFGYRLKQGRLEKIPQLGSVRIESDVEIGACATIDRGMIGPTVIGTGTKIDNLVMIGHNCEIGRHNAFASQTGFAGSCTTGDYVRAGGQCGIGDHLTIGHQATLAASIALHNNVPDGETWAGYPARRMDEAVRILTTQGKLPEMRLKLREMERQLVAVTKKLESLESHTKAA